MITNVLVSGWTNKTETVHILDRSKSCKSIVIDVNTQRIIASDVDINAEVELARVYQIRQCYVVLDNNRAAFWNL